MTANPSAETPALPESPEPQAPPLTAGQLLRAARLKAGVHLALLSVTLKVPVKQLEALESDEFDPAKGPVFFRSLASAVCRHLQIDPAPILALLPLAPAHLGPPRSVGQGRSGIQRTGALPILSTKSRPTVLWGAPAMLILIAALLWLPGPSQWLWLEGLNHWVQTLRQSEESSPDGAAISPVSQSLGMDSQDARTVVEAVAMPMPVSMVPETMASAASSHTPSPAASGIGPVSPPAASALTSPRQDLFPVASKSDAAEWVFTASEDCWIELRHAQTTVVWSGLIKAGQSQRVPSPLPVSVVVGRAQAMTVTLRGKPFDLKPHTQSTVARFEVKD